MLRGLCSNKWVDEFYTVKWDPATNMPYFLGFVKSIIRYDEDAETWQLTSTDGSVNGSSVARIESMGTGVRGWRFDRDICNSDHQGDYKALLTACSLQQFTCSSDGGLRIANFYHLYQAPV
jgi:hypothetical protein